MKKKKIIIMGAGPAGLTAAYYLLKNSKDYDIVILEKEKQVGGISKTISYNGNKMDLGGHRFFSKDEQINNLWKNILPVQGLNSYDDIILNNNNKKLSSNGVNPEKEDKVLLIRNRVSRIYYKKKFFDYPINLNIKTIKNLGLINTFTSGFSYLKSIFLKKDESNLENFYINRFGYKLYSIFFKGYTEKLWGRSPNKIDASWGAQRVKGLSIREVIKDFIYRTLNIKTSKKETSLIENFYYPKFGPGQMYEEIENQIIKMGGKVIKNSEIIKINNKNKKIESIVYRKDKKENILEGDIFISSIAIKDLIECMNKVPSKIYDIAVNLPYRDFITIGLIVKKLKIKNTTNIKTLNNIIPDCWIYVQGNDVKLGRIQVFNNWSPYLVKDVNNTISLGLEYFCQEEDGFWNKTNEELKNYAINDLIKMNILESKDDVLDYHIEKVKKAYPAYFDSYKYFDNVKNYLNKYDNLYCIGRNGQHHYNNMDHSMKTAIICIDNILNGNKNKENVWNVNVEEQYHEIKVTENN